MDAMAVEPLDINEQTVFSTKLYKKALGKSVVLLMRNSNYHCIIKYTWLLNKFKSIHIQKLLTISMGIHYINLYSIIFEFINDIYDL